MRAGLHTGVADVMCGTLDGHPSCVGQLGGVLRAGKWAQRCLANTGYDDAAVQGAQEDASRRGADVLHVVR